MGRHMVKVSGIGDETEQPIGRRDRTFGLGRHLSKVDVQV